MTPGIRFLASGVVTDGMAAAAEAIDVTSPITDPLREMQALLTFQREVGAALNLVFGPASWRDPVAAYNFMPVIGSFIGASAALLPGDNRTHLADMLELIRHSAEDGFAKAREEWI